MRRRLSAAVIVLLLVAGILWWVRGRTHDAAVPTDDVIVALRVDGRFDATIERGEPLLFEVFLMGRTATASATLGSAPTPWPRLVSLRREQGAALGEPLVLGAPRAIGIVLNGGIPSVLADDDRAIARIVGRQRTYGVALGFPPELTSSLPPGRHTFRAALGEVTSSPVSVVVTEPAPDRELERLRRSASFFVRAGKYDEGKSIAATVLARQPADVAANIAIGDAWRGLGRPVEARAAYLKALDALRSGRQFHEEPEPLFARIREADAYILRLAGGTRPFSRK
jgi:hypothetical protein